MTKPTLNRVVGVLWTGFLATVAISVQAEQGIQAGPLTLSPFAGLTATYDSNVGRASNNEQDDTFLESSLGLKLDARIQELAFNGLGFVVNRSYADNDQLDFWAWGEALKLKYGSTSRISLEAQQSFRRVEDLDTFGSEAEIGGMSPDAFLDADVRSRRELLEAGAVLEAHLTDKTDISAGYRYNETDYQSDSLFDLSGHGTQIEAAHRITDKSAALLSAQGGLQSSEFVSGDAQYAALRVGMRTWGTDRLSVRAGAGYQQLDRPEDGGTDEGFNYDATAQWTITDKTRLELEGRNGMQLSSIHRANAVEYSVVRLGLAYRMSSSLALGASTVYRIDDYKDPVASGSEMVDRKDEGATIKLRADYLLPAKYARLFAEAVYETVDSNIRDYDVTRANLGIAIQL